MSKRGYLYRYAIILKKIKSDSYCSLKELQRYFHDQVEDLRYLDDTVEVGSSIRTFQRDFTEIRNNFGINIEYSRTHNGYFINQTEREDRGFQRMMEAFDIFNTLNIAKDYTPFIHFEKRKPQGTDNLHGIVHAIQNNLKLSFTYYKFWDDEKTERVVEPYALQEFKNRWYLLARDDKDGKLKNFALDRISSFHISKKKFQRDKDFNIDQRFRNFFGIISPDGFQPQRVVLSFNSFQGKYIKSLPLHESQRIIHDQEDELQIELELCITHDFVMELLSYGSNMTVLQPKSLAKQIKETHLSAAKNYK